MRNKLSSTWGVTPGRVTGAGVTKRFHKRREGTEAERAVAKALGVPLAEARRQLRYAQSYNAGRSADSKQKDWLTLEAMRRDAAQREEEKAQREEQARRERVAAYLETK
jgi:hypothetical protein